jgi:hypothetical protein
VSFQAFTSARKRSVCQGLADAMELRAWDIVCAEQLSKERKQDKEES